MSQVMEQITIREDPIRHVYVSLAYPLSNSKYLTVGLFEQRNYDVCFCITSVGTQRCSHQVLIDFSEWIYLMTFRERISDGLQHHTKSVKILFTSNCTNNNEQLKSVTVKERKCGDTYVCIQTNKKTQFCLTAKEWYCCISLLPILNKYSFRLYEEQKNLKYYIENVLTLGQIMIPSNTTLDSITYGRLYDELLLNDKTIGHIKTQPVEIQHEEYME